MHDGTFQHWDTHLAEATWPVNTRGGSASQPSPDQTKLQHTLEGGNIPNVHIRNLLGKTV